MRVIYMDNAATSYPKPKIVIDSMVECMKKYCANPGRGSHYMSIRSGNEVLKAREAVSEFFSAPGAMNVIFTQNATQAINYVLKGVIKPGYHVITTSVEHNSVMRPLKTMESNMEIELEIIRCDRHGNLDPAEIKKAVKKNTMLIVTTYSSNVNGTILPVKEIGNIAAENGIKYLIDASQGAGCCKIDMKELNATFLAFPGHKGLMGPQGTGGLIIDEGIEMDTIIEGGTGSDSASLLQPQILPDKFESGTVNVPGIVGLRNAIEYINMIGIDKIRKHKNMLVKRLMDGISRIKGITMYSIPDTDMNSGIVALGIKDTDSTEISSILNSRYGIATRAGLHCSPHAHMTFGTLEHGVVRISPGWFNTLGEIDKVIKCLERITVREEKFG